MLDAFSDATNTWKMIGFGDNVRYINQVKIFKIKVIGIPRLVGDL